MTNHAEKAGELFRKGANCSQAVFAAFSDVTGISETESLKMSAPFGGGFGRMREVCGAVSGMLMAFGCVSGYSNLTDSDTKTAHYKAVHELMLAFEKEMGSYNCKQLLGITDFVYSPIAKPRTPDFFETRPCLKCVMTAADILDEYINK